MATRSKDLPISVSVLSREEQDQILAEAYKRLGISSFFTSLEDLITSRSGMGLPATDVQRAVFRAVQGRPLADLQANAEVRAVLGLSPSVQWPLDGVLPREVLLLSGTRTGKSMLAAGAAIWASQTCDVSRLAPGEIPRYSIVSLSLDNSRVIMGHLVGALQQPALAHLRVADAEAKAWTELIEETQADAAWSVFVWHPSGRPVEIRVVAGKRAGGSVVSRWSCGLCLDEAARMVGSGDAVVNYDDMVAAVRSRLLPGAQVLSISSPWQPYGPVYDMAQNSFGEPSASLVVIKATGPQMNPTWWTPERCEEMRAFPVQYRTDVLAEFADLEEALFPMLVLDKCVRKSVPVLPFDERHEYVAAMDPATRGNAWTLVICDRKGRKKRVVLATQWIGNSNAPLSPKAVLAEAKELLAAYHLDWAFTDQWAADALKDIALDLGMVLLVEDWTERNKVDAFLSLATSMAEGEVELPNDSMVLKDLRLTKKMPTQRGVSIRLTSTPDGRHCDYAPALARALQKWIADERQDVPQKGDVGYSNFVMAELEAKEASKMERSQKNGDWWAADPRNGFQHDEVF